MSSVQTEGLRPSTQPTIEQIKTFIHRGELVLSAPPQVICRGKFVTNVANWAVSVRPISRPIATGQLSDEARAESRRERQ
jgi:hypothetical protein